MSCNIKTLDDLQRNMQFDLPTAEYQRQYQAIIAQHAKNAPQRKGFRKGKMSQQVAEQLLSKKDRENIRREVLTNCFLEHCKEHKLKPEQNSITFELPTDLTQATLQCNFDFEVLPDIQLHDLSKMQLERLSATVDDAAIERATENLRLQFATWKDKDAEATAESGDQVIIDFVGRTAEGEFKGGKSNDFKLVLGAGNMIPGFEDPIIGLKVGAQCESQVTFPDPYHAKELAGKPATFNITIKAIQRKILPELNETFLKQTGITDGKPETLKQELKLHLQRQLEQIIFDKLRVQVAKHLCEDNPITLPKSLVNLRVKQMQYEAIQRITQQTSQQPPKDFPMDPKLFEEQAKQQVQTGLLISHVVEQQNIQITSEEIQQQLQTIAQSYQDPESLVEQYQKNRQFQAQVHQTILERKAIEWIIDQAQVTDKQVSFEQATAADTEHPPAENAEQDPS